MQTNTQTNTQTNGVAKVCRALLKARAEFGPILRNKENPHFRSRYADLQSVLDAVEDSLAKHGLVLVQRTACDDRGVTLVTELIEVESGEILSSVYPLAPSKQNDPQSLGGAMTYARRYCALALLGLAPEDDDGNAASQKAKPARQQEARTAPVPGKPRPQPAQTQPPLPDLSEEDAAVLDDWRATIEESRSIAELTSHWNGLDADFKRRLLATKDAVKARLQGGA